MTSGPGLDLGRPRQVGELFRDSLELLLKNLGSFLLISAAIVVPVELIVLGVGLEELTARYRDDPSPAEVAIPTAVSFFLIVPLVTATTIYALRSLEGGEGARPGASLQQGLEAFTPLFAPLVLAAVGVALGLALLVLPGIYLLVRWYFVPQAVVLDGVRGVPALEHSASAVRGNWWRTAGVIFLVNLAVAAPGLLVLSGFAGVARELDSQAVALAGSMVVDTVSTPFVALVATLLYYDLRARAARWSA